MKAIVCTKYGSPDVLQLQEVAKPSPKDDEVLIKIHAASINARDWRMMRAKPFFIRLMPGGFLQPQNKILGADLAGRVEVVGRDARQYKPDDEVFGYLPSSTDRGTFAEYVCAKENLITLKPANLTFEQSCGCTACSADRLAGITRQRKHPARAKGFDLWRFWWRRNICRADCQSVRSGSHGRMQSEESGNGALAWGRSRHRLQERRFYQKRAAIRPDPGCEWILSDFRLSTFIKTGRNLGCCWWLAVSTRPGCDQ